MQKVWLGGLILAACGATTAARAAAPNSLILNEANMVSGSKFLDQDRPAGARNRADLTLGRLQGNGQNWLEFLAVQGDDLGGGAYGNTLDLRGWKIAWSYDKNDPTDPNKYGSGTIEFTNDPLWAAIPKGTLLTINEWKEAWYHDAGTDVHNNVDFHGLQRDGGINGLGTQKGDPYNPQIHQLRSFATDAQWNPFSSGSDGVNIGQTGDWGIKVWAGERNPDNSFKYFNFTGSVVNGDPQNPIPVGTEDGGLYALNNDNWQYSILQPVQGGPDNVIQGPIGEALSFGSASVGADELYRLENFPVRNPPATQANYLNASIADYVDGTSSAYGRPNVWSGGSFVQDLASLRSWVKPGDVNLDGKVNGADFLAWQKGLGNTHPSFTNGDLDGNGIVNAADLTVWKGQFGIPAVPSGSAVPEGASATLAAAAIIAAGGALRRRTR